MNRFSELSRLFQEIERKRRARGKPFCAECSDTGQIEVVVNTTSKEIGCPRCAYRKEHK